MGGVHGVPALGGPVRHGPLAVREVAVVGGMLDYPVQRDVLDDLQLPHLPLPSSASSASGWASAERSPFSMPGIVCSMASTLENHVTMVSRDPVGLASKAN